MKIIHLIAFQILATAFIFKFTSLKFASVYKIAAYFIYPVLILIFFVAKYYYELTVMAELNAPLSNFTDLLFNYVTLIYILFSLFIQFILSYFLFSRLREEQPLGKINKRSKGGKK